MLPPVTGTPTSAMKATPIFSISILAPPPATAPAFTCLRRTVKLAIQAIQVMWLLLLMGGRTLRFLWKRIRMLVPVFLGCILCSLIIGLLALHLTSDVETISNLCLINLKTILLSWKCYELYDLCQ